MVKDVSLVTKDVFFKNVEKYFEAVFYSFLLTIILGCVYGLHTKVGLNNDVFEIKWLVSVMIAIIAGCLVVHPFERKLWAKVFERSEKLKFLRTGKIIGIFFGIMIDALIIFACCLTSGISFIIGIPLGMIVGILSAANKEAKKIRDNKAS